MSEVQHTLSMQEALNLIPRARVCVHIIDYKYAKIWEKPKIYV
jgi:hypothetical protein